MSGYRVDSVESLHKAGFTSLLVCGVGEVEARDDTISTLQAELKVHLENLNSQDAKIDRLEAENTALVEAAKEVVAVLATCWRSTPNTLEESIGRQAALLQSEGEI